MFNEMLRKSKSRLSRIYRGLLLGKVIKVLTIFYLSAFTLQAQDITNKLGTDDASATYDVTNQSGNVLFRVQGDGNAMLGTTATSGKLSVDSDGSTAIYGNQSSSTGSTYGIFGNTNAATGAGVKGTAGPTGANFGGHFTAPAMDGTGVYGQGTKYSGYFKQGDFVIETGDVGIGTTTPDATLDVHGTVKVFGDWALDAYYVDVAYRVSTDGFIIARISKKIDWSWVRIEGYTDSSNPPTTEVVHEMISNLLNTGGTVSTIMPVKKGDYFLITDGNGGSNTLDFRINWIPLGQ